MVEQTEKTVQFEAVEVKEIKFGKNKFLEVAYKRAKTPTGTTDFVSISKGFVNEQGKKIFKGSIGFPVDAQLRNDLIAALQTLKTTG